MKKSLWLILASLCFSASAKAVYEANNGDTINATVSTKDLTRIEIEGQKIIKDFSTANLSKKITKPLGQVYLIPNTNATFNLYLVSDTGNTYNLKLTPSKNVTGDSIIIKPIDAPQKARSQLTTAPSTYIKGINYLMEIMYLSREEDSEYEVSTPNQAITTYDGLDSVLYKAYRSANLIGYVLLLKNTSKNKILLTEAEFYSPHTLAVSIENPNIKTNDFTRVFIVKDSE